MINKPRLTMRLPDSDWRDPSWTTLKSLRGGITDAIREDRKTMFDQNTIEIEARSIGQLLVDEVLHPFYIFQIASIILWSLDDYYFYAVTIALISVLSISTTLIETRNVRSSAERRTAREPIVLTVSSQSTERRTHARDVALRLHSPSLEEVDLGASRLFGARPGRSGRLVRRIDAHLPCRPRPALR